jgi:Putative transmembrane protein (Alph_Pro_TM)
MSAAPLVAALLFASRLVCPPLAFRVMPHVIEVGTFYDGAKVKVEGIAASGSQVIVTVTGPHREERFNRKAPFGPIWLNAGKVRISGAPSLFLRFSAEPVRSLLGRDALARRSLDEASLAKQIQIEPFSGDSGADTALRAEYLALKKRNKTYRFANAGVVMGQSGDDGVPYTLDFDWPKKAPPADYKVHVYEIREGTVVREGSAPISVVRAGFPAWLAGMAESRASVYGASAVLIGALAGFGIDFLTTHVFRKKRPPTR